MMNILFTITDNYTPYCGVALISFLENNRWDKFDIYIISDGLTDRNRNSLSEICRHYHTEIFFFELNDNVRERIRVIEPYLPKGQHISFTFRFFVTELLPTNIDTILYIDSDLIVNESCEELQNILFDKWTSLYAVMDIVRWPDDYTRLNINSNSHKYFNAGVMYMNLEY